MTATEARRGLILLPIKCTGSCSAHAYNRGSSPSPIPDLPGIGGPSPPPSPPICRGSGVHPRRHPRFAGGRGSSPSPVPIGGSVPWPLGHVQYHRCWVTSKFQAMARSSLLLTMRTGPLRLAGKKVIRRLGSEASLSRNFTVKANSPRFSPVLAPLSSSSISLCLSCTFS
jgi:hypothetical protein